MKRRRFIQNTGLGTLAVGTLGSYALTSSCKPIRKGQRYCYESEREIPILEDVDVLVVGGSSGAVAAASAAAKKGCSVFLVGYLPYLGDDICGTYRYWLKDGENPDTTLAKKIFGEKTPTPMHVKSILDKELIDNGVKFFYSCYATNLIFDGSNNVSGAVVVSRSGRQAIKAKVVIDATHGAELAKMAGAGVEQYSLKEIDFFYTVVGNHIKKSGGTIDVRKRPDPVITEGQSYKVLEYQYQHIGNDPKNEKAIVDIKELPEQIGFEGQSYDVLEYQFQFDLKDSSYASLLEVEHEIRSKTFDIEQTDCSDLLHYLPPYKIVCEKTYSGNGISTIPVEAFIPKNTKNILILNGCADVNRETAKELNSSIALMKLGGVIGKYSAELSKTISLPGTICSKSRGSGDYLRNGEVKEYLRPLRPVMDKGYVKSLDAILPVLGEYDVVVSGGGTAGAPAGIGASKHGAKTLVLEYLHGLGGIGTMGHMEYYWDGNRDGFTEIVDKGVRGMAPDNHPRQIKDKGGWVFDWKTEWYRKEILRNGGDIWFGAMGCGTWMENDTVKGVVVSTPYGRGVVLCKVVIDSSGSADLAIASGAKYEFIDAKSVAVQGAGLAYRFPGHIKANTDWTFMDESDILDTARLFVQGKKKFSTSYDICKLPQTRERRRQLGEYTVTTYDIMNKRRYEDTISHHIASFDTHGYTIDPIFSLKPETGRTHFYNADMPLRSLLPKGINGLITSGLGASAQRDAMPVLRMQACLQNQGYAVGYLAAVAVKENEELRQVDVKKIQKHLVEIGSLPERVLTDNNTEEFSDIQLQEAADAVVNNYEKLEVLLTNHTKTNEIITERFLKADNHNDKLVYASILAILNNNMGWKVILDEVKSYSKWDEGWHFAAHGYERRLSDLDFNIIKLGYTKAPEGLPTIIKKAGELITPDYFSHFRAIAVAFETMRSDKAVDVLENLLEKDEMQGYFVKDYEDALKKMDIKNFKHIRPDDDLRNRELKEIFLARALYRCGDKNGLGKRILTNYAKGLNGIYAAHAWGVLNE